MAKRLVMIEIDTDDFPEFTEDYFAEWLGFWLDPTGSIMRTTNPLYSIDLEAKVKEII